MKTFQRLTLTAILSASALLVTGCGGNGTAPAAAAPSATVVASPEASSSPKVTASDVPGPVLGAGIVAKGVANDGKGVYLQTSIADTDPVMKYDPALADDAAKANFPEAELAEAQKVAAKFIAEEIIDSTLNGGSTDIDGWYAAHKDQILPENQSIMLADLKAGKNAVILESWMATKPGYSYVHGDATPRVTARTITPIKLRFVESGTLKGLMLDTNVSYSMAVTGGKTNIQSSSGEISLAVAKDPTDGKWKMAGYDVQTTTAEG